MKSRINAHIYKQIMIPFSKQRKEEFFTVDTVGCTSDNTWTEKNKEGLRKT